MFPGNDPSGDDDMTAISAPAPARRTGRPDSAIASLAIDIAIPLAIYYLLHDAFGLSLVTAVAASSVVPAARTVYAALRDRELNQLAALMLALNAATVVISLISGDARLLFAREAAISSVIGFAALATVVTGRTPMFAPGVEVFMTRGEHVREAAWRRLAAGDRAFTTMLRRHTVIWGVVLIVDCTARVVCAYTMPVSDLPWLSTAITVGSILLATIVSGAAYGERIQRALDAEIER
jgi:hypothetical protein